MKIKKDYVLRQVADIYLVLPLGQATIDFNGMVKLNESGAFLWRQMEAGTTREVLADLLTAEYDVSREKALTDIDAFVATLKSVGCIEE